MCVAMLFGSVSDSPFKTTTQSRTRPTEHEPTSQRSFGREGRRPACSTSLRLVRVVDRSDSFTISIKRNGRHAGRGSQRTTESGNPLPARRMCAHLRQAGVFSACPVLSTGRPLLLCVETFNKTDTLPAFCVFRKIHAYSKRAEQGESTVAS